MPVSSDDGFVGSQLFTILAGITVFGIIVRLCCSQSRSQETIRKFYDSVK